MNKNTIYLFIVGVLMFAACDPIEDRQSLDPTKTESELLETVSVTVDGNTVLCETTETSSIVQWNSTSGWMATGPMHEFVIALAGDYQVDISFYGGDKVVTVSKNITIAQDDPEFFDHPYWQLLAKTAEGAKSKTWVWADDNTYQPDCVWGKGGWLGTTANWWGPSVADVINDKGISLSDKVTFSMEGLKFDTESAAAPGNGSGSWVLKVGGDNIVNDADGNPLYEGTLSLTGHTIPWGIDGDHGAITYYEFYIVSLTENELRLCVEASEEGGAAWYWHFKKEGYNY
ncbi:hypothetical protein [Ancylomarina sp. 16SWW S1-10-2]|uniref:hypothetical protein n=1 Tax=Ancylomarina sp. 16SWW S1-10-2 TaxID=2499681 RepID=UPI0012AD626C|nr:hypothetical protein [Ancylomarina sp. 16SWW S1-10-2]MRT92054.1 hypothetical protein [Ancylomarina sp. 16SWW S1-10-2]